MARRARGRAARALLAVLMSAGVIAAAGVAATALARQAAASDAGSVGRTALTAADASPAPSATVSTVPGVPPLSVNAGPDQTVTGTTVVHLAGSVSDPAATTNWSMESGPAATASNSVPAGSAAFGGMSPTTTATVTEAGEYVFQLTAVDGSQTASDTVTIKFDLGIPAGTFIALTYPSSARLACTTGFGVAMGGVAYELGAKHCIDGDVGDQATNSRITEENQPVTIQQLLGLDPTTGAPILGTVYASINCLQPSADCLVPAPLKLSLSGRYETGDMMAWKPANVVPSALVQTVYGLLPVVGQEDLTEGTQVCHYGWGSFANASQHAEQCGSPAPAAEESACFGGSSNFGCQPDTLDFEAHSYGGDSGGPVYSYDMVNGRPVGVWAIGIDIREVNVGILHHNLLGPSYRTVFIPMPVIEDRLGVTLLTQAPLPSASA